MSSENRRTIIFVVATFASILAIQYVMEVSGLIPPPPKNPPVAVAKNEAAKPQDKDKAAAQVQAKGDAGKPEAKGVAASAPPKAEAPAAAKPRERAIKLAK